MNPAAAAAALFIKLLLEASDLLCDDFFFMIYFFTIRLIQQRYSCVFAPRRKYNLKSNIAHPGFAWTMLFFLKMDSLIADNYFMTDKCAYWSPILYSSETDDPGTTLMTFIIP